MKRLEVAVRSLSFVWRIHLPSNYWGRETWWIPTRNDGSRRQLGILINGVGRSAEPESLRVGGRVVFRSVIYLYLYLYLCVYIVPSYINLKHCLSLAPVSADQRARFARAKALCHYPSYSHTLDIFTPTTKRTW